MNEESFAVIQRNLCEKYASGFAFSKPESITGVAVNALKPLWPLNGLRHPMEGQTNGWFIWGGIEISPEPDFFRPMHTSHIYEKIPIVTKFLGLAPGWRFIVDDSYEDVWFDESLLRV